MAGFAFQILCLLVARVLNYHMLKSAKPGIRNHGLGVHGVESLFLVLFFWGGGGNRVSGLVYINPVLLGGLI